MDQIDTDKNGTIERAEFIKFYSNHLQSQDDAGKLGLILNRTRT